MSPAEIAAAAAVSPLSRVYWVAVPQALRARRVNNRRRPAVSSRPRSRRRRRRRAHVSRALPTSHAVDFD
jgi:hypothetical protein